MPSEYFIDSSVNLIATLGDARINVSCSLLASLSRFPSARMIGCENFEIAVSKVKSGEAEKVVVPSAYPKIASILMDESLKLDEVYRYKIPSLVLATTGGEIKKREILYYMPATYSLINNISNFEFSVGVQTASNELAAMRLLSHTECGAAGCITNAVVAKHFNLIVHQVLRSERDMGFHVFIRSGDKQ
jgi:hypothetical protein